MPLIKRLVNAARAVLGDPVERRAYVSRFKFLIRGTEKVRAWGLEYRAALSGRFSVALDRLATDEAEVFHCPVDCPSGAPLAHLYKRRHVYQICNTVVHTGNGGTLSCGTPEAPFFVRESISWPYESVLVHGFDVPEVQQATREIFGPAVVFPTTRNHYHWTVEELPLVLRAHEVAPNATLVSYASGVTNKHRLVANHLGMRLEEGPRVVRLREQVLPGRANDSFYVHPSDLRMLRSFGMSISEASEPERASYPQCIYVSRRNSRRPLKDEALLENVLADQGFEIVYAERIPWIEQVRIFQHAQLVIAPHGAGLANLVFAPPGIRVLELTVGSHYNRAFEWISHMAGINYRWTEADADLGPESTLHHQVLSLTADWRQATAG